MHLKIYFLCQLLTLSDGVQGVIYGLSFLCLCSGDIMFLGCPSVHPSIPFSWMRYLRNTLREFLQIWHKRPLGRMNWLDFVGQRSKVRVTVNSRASHSRERYMSGTEEISLHLAQLLERVRGVIQDDFDFVFLSATASTLSSSNLITQLAFVNSLLKLLTSKFWSHHPSTPLWRTEHWLL